MHVKMSLVSIKLIDVTKGELLVSSLIQGYFGFIFVRLVLKDRLLQLWIWFHSLVWYKGSIRVPWPFSEATSIYSINKKKWPWYDYQIMILENSLFSLSQFWRQIGPIQEIRALKSFMLRLEKVESNIINYTMDMKFGSCQWQHVVYIN